MATQIALWSGPRNVSTALMYSFAQRADTTVVDEPLFGHFLKATGVERPSRSEALATMETDPKKVLEGLESSGENQEVLFMKHMANHLVGLDCSIAHNWKNVLLTRHPNQVLTSYVKQVKSPTVLDLAYAFQTQLLVALTKSSIPVWVVDSGTFLQNPEKGLREICAFAEISFDTKMLSWSAGARKEDGVWAKYWYHNLHKSTGFGPYRKKSEKVPDHLESVLNDCLPHYHLLKKHINTQKL